MFENITNMGGWVVGWVRGMLVQVLNLEISIKLINFKYKEVLNTEGRKASLANIYLEVWNKKFKEIQVSYSYINMKITID